MTLLPAFLDLRGEAVSVVGGGGVALRRTRSLLEAGARVRVIAPERHPDFGTLAVEWVARAYRSGDLHGARVVVAATDSDEVNAEVRSRTTGHPAAEVTSGAADFEGRLLITTLIRIGWRPCSSVPHT